MSRLKILSDDDFDNLYSIPKLEKEDRPYVFDLDETDHRYLKTLTDIPCKIDYMLQLAYFRLSQYFYSMTFHGVREDVWYIIKTYFPEAKFPKKTISKHLKYQNREAILQKYEMAIYTKGFQNNLNQYAKVLAKKHVVPKYIFDLLLDFCHQNKIVRPGYSILQSVVSEALENEKKRLSNKLYTLMDKPLRDDLNKLLEKSDDYYQLTAIKKDQKDFSTTEIKNTITKHNSLSSIYKRSIKIIEQLGLSEQNVLYYADLAMYHTIYSLKGMKKKNVARLYLICYAHYRYLKINDHLIFSFVHKVNRYLNSANKHQEEAYGKHLLDENDDRNKAADILLLFGNRKVTDNELRTQAYKIIAKELLPNLIRRIRKPKFNAEYHRWEYYTEISSAIKQNIRGSFKVLDFQSKNKDIEAAINFLKQHFESKLSFKSYHFRDIPIQFIPRSLRRYVIEKIREAGTSKKVKKINGDRYEFMLYLMIEKSINKGATTIKDSLSYKALRDELIPDSEWSKNKTKLIKSLENKLLQTDIKVILSSLNKDLDPKYHKINQNIDKGINDKIKLKHNKQG